MISTLSHSDGMWGNFDSDKAIQIWLPYWLNIIENKAGFLRILEDGGSNLPAAEHQPTTPRACSGLPPPLAGRVEYCSPWSVQNKIYRQLIYFRQRFISEATFLPKALPRPSTVGKTRFPPFRFLLLLEGYREIFERQQIKFFSQISLEVSCQFFPVFITGFFIQSSRF